MTSFVSYKALILRYFLAAAIAFSLILLLAAPLSNSALALKVHEIKVRPDHRTVRNVIVCNVTDTASNGFGTIGTKLPSSVTYRVNSFSAPHSVVSNVSTIVGNSFNTWGSAVPSVTFTKGSDTLAHKARFDGQNVIAWGRLPLSTLGATYIWYNTSTGQVVEVDTILNSRQPWSWTDPTTVDVDQTCPSTNAYDAQGILTHEIGHWMGLDDLYVLDDEDLTLFGYGSKQELKKDTPGSGDILGLGSIYP